MTEIYLQQFIGYSEKSILQFIRIQSSQRFAIYIPKQSVGFIDKDFKVFWEYYYAYYIGEKLSAVVKAFGYSVPAINERGFFVFVFSAKKFKAISKILSLAVKIFFCENDEDLRFQFEAEKEIESTMEGKSNHCCWGLYDISERVRD